MANQKQDQIKVDLHTTTQIYNAAKYITDTINNDDWGKLKESSPEYENTMRRIYSHLQLILMTFETLDDEQQEFIINNIIIDGDVESLKTFLNDAAIDDDNLIDRAKRFNNFVSGNIVKEFHIPVEAVTMELTAWGQLVMEHYKPNPFENKSIEEQVDFINSVCPFVSPLNYNKDTGLISMNTMKAGFPDVVIVDKNGVLHGEAATCAPISDIIFESDQQERHHAVLIYINHHLKDFLKEYAQTIVARENSDNFNRAQAEAKREELKEANWKNETMINIYNNYLGSKATTETVVENQRKLVSDMARENTYDDTKATFSFLAALSNVIGTKKRADRTDINDLSGAVEVDVNKLRDDVSNILTYSQRLFNMGEGNGEFTKKFAQRSLIYSHKSITDGVNSSYILLDIDNLLNSFKPIMEKLNDISPESDEGKVISSYFNSNGQTRMLFHSFFLLDPTFNSDKWAVSLPEKARSLITEKQKNSTLSIANEAKNWLLDLYEVDPALLSEIHVKLKAMKEEGKSQELIDKYLIDQHALYIQRDIDQQKSNFLDHLEAPTNTSDPSQTKSVRIK